MDGESPPPNNSIWTNGQKSQLSTGTSQLSTGTSQLSTGQRKPLNHGTEPSTWKTLKWKMYQKPSIE